MLREMSFGGTDYRKQEKDLLLDLIEEANPGWAENIPLDDVVFGTPTVLTPVDSEGRNTSITIKAKQGSTSVIGSRVIKYRRLDVGKLFRGRSLVLTKYTTLNVLPYADILELLLSQCGINFDPTDMLAGTVQAGNSRSFAIQPSSLCYTGSLTFVWNKGKRDISELLTDGLLDGRVYPQGLIDVQDGSKPQGELMFYNTDFTALSMAAWFNGVTSGGFDNGAWNTSVNSTALVNLLKTLRPDIPWSRGHVAITKGGIGYCYFKRYTLPHADVPEANVGLFKRVMVLEPANMANPDNWFFGRIYLHYS